MARKSSFDKKDLAWECSQIKRKLINDALKGRFTQLSKSAVFEMIAKRPRIGLKSARMLWTGPHREYLDTWFTKLNEEVESILNSPSAITVPAKSHEELASDYQELEAKVKHLTQLVHVYRTANDQLRVENIKYRMLVTERFGHIDDLETLNK